MWNNNSIWRDVIQREEGRTEEGDAATWRVLFLKKEICEGKGNT